MKINGYCPRLFPRLFPRALCRYRDDLVKDATAAKNRLKEPVVDPWVRKEEKRRLRRFEQDIEKAEKKIEEHIATHHELKCDAQLLKTMHGVGPVTATVILGELGDLRQFGKARQLTAFVGLSPEHNESGTSVHKRVRLSKKGNGRVRKALFLAALTAVRYPNNLKCTYEKLIRQGKSKMAALGAVMRKMLCIMRAMLITNTTFDRRRGLCG